MSDKKSKPMSLSIETEMQELLTQSAKKAGISKSQLVRDLVDNYLDCVMNRNEEIPFVFQVPVGLKGNHAELKKWFEEKTEAVIKTLL